MNLAGITGFVLDVAAGAAHHHFLQHRVAHLLVDIIDMAGEVVGTQDASLRHEAFEFLNPRGESVGDITHTVEGAAGGILEQQQLGLDILRRVVERGSREQENTLASFYIALVESCRLADALQQVVVVVAVVAEVVRLIDNDKVVVFLLIVAVALNDLIKAAVGDKAAVFVLDAKIRKSVFPVAFYRWWEDDEDAGVVTIGGDETLRNHSSHHGFTQAHHVSNEASTVLHHNVISLHHSVALIGEVVVVVGQLWNEIILNLIAEVVDEHPHV